MIKTLFRRRVCAAVIVTALISLMACTSAGQSGQPSTTGAAKKLAVVNGETVTEDQVKLAASSDLENLELRRLQSEAGFKRDEQSIYERTLSQIIDDKVIAERPRARAPHS